MRSHRSGDQWVCPTGDQWVCSTGDQSSENHIEGLEVISGCGPVSMDHCTSIGVVWRGSVGVVQCVSSGGGILRASLVVGMWASLGEVLRGSLGVVLSGSLGVVLRVSLNLVLRG